MKWIMLTLLALSVSCAKSNGSSTQGSQQPANQLQLPTETAAASHVAHTDFTDLFGTYETLSMNGFPIITTVPVTDTHAPVVKCEPYALIGQSDLSRQTAAGVETSNVDAYDPITKNQLAADELWFATGYLPITGNGGCVVHALPLLRARGYWTSFGAVLSYSFTGTVLRVVDGKKVEETGSVSLVVTRLTDKVINVQINYFTNLDTFSGLWTLQKTN